MRRAQRALVWSTLLAALWIGAGACVVLGMAGCSRARNLAHKVINKAHSAVRVLEHELERRTRHSDYHTAVQPPRVPLGLNVSGVNYFTTSSPFVDLMKNANFFESTDAGGNGPWDTHVADLIPRDAQGYPLELPYVVESRPQPQIVRASIGLTLYSGRYVLLYDGDGEVGFPSTKLKVVSKTPGRMELDIEGSQGILFLSITRSAKADHLRNLRLLLPGFEQSYASQPFHPQFLQILRGASVLRFMDWGQTNNSPLQHWEQRPTPDVSQGTGRGVALEYMVALANQLEADPWFCVPHQADDDYIEQMAQLVRLQLDPRRKLYIEDSNEVWNPQFTQHDYAADRGCQAGLNELEPYPGPCNAGGRHWAAVKWHAKRSADIFRIFQRVFGGEQRLVRVLSGQAGYLELNEALLVAFNNPKINPAHVHADALAIAPYFGGGVGDSLVGQGLVQSVDVDEIVHRTQASLAGQVGELTNANKQLADGFGLNLVAYEAGQTLVGTGPNTRDELLAQKLMLANRHPGMGAAYDTMFDLWYKYSGGQLLMLFNSVEAPGRFGNWGLLESQTQAPESSPKYVAFHNRLAALARAVAH